MPTDIEWVKNADGSRGSSWNCVTGCKPDFPCWAHCYARRMSKRLRGRSGYPRDDPFRPTFHADKLDQPLHWKKPRVIFVCSMGDLFCDGVKREWQDAVIDVILADTPHTFILLTKRVKEAGEYLSRFYLPDFGERLVLGTSISTQDDMHRVADLGQIPAWRRVVSVEPMLSAIDMHLPLPPEPYGPINGIICGCETGPGARSMNIDWARGLRDQCALSGVSFFLKKLSDGTRLLDGREHNDVAWGRKEKS